MSISSPSFLALMRRFQNLAELQVLKEVSFRIEDLIAVLALRVPNFEVTLEVVEHCVNAALVNFTTDRTLKDLVLAASLYVLFRAPCNVQIEKISNINAGL